MEFLIHRPSEARHVGTYPVLLVPWASEKCPCHELIVSTINIINSDVGVLGYG